MSIDFIFTDETVKQFESIIDEVTDGFFNDFSNKYFSEEKKSASEEDLAKKMIDDIVNTLTEAVNKVYKQNGNKKGTMDQMTEEENGVLKLNEPTKDGCEKMGKALASMLFENYSMVDKIWTIFYKGVFGYPVQIFFVVFESILLTLIVSIIYRRHTGKSVFDMCC